MVMSLEFQPIRCATMLCHFGRIRNGYVATRFILLSSTAGAVLQAAPWSCRNAPDKVKRELVETWNGLRKSLVLFPAADLINAFVTTCKHELFPSYISTLFYVFHLFSMYFYQFPLLENLLDLLFLLSFIVSAR